MTGLPEPYAGLGSFNGKKKPLLQHLLLPYLGPSSKKKQKANPKGYFKDSLISCGEMGSAGRRTSKM